MNGQTQSTGSQNESDKLQPRRRQKGNSLNILRSGGLGFVEPAVSPPVSPDAPSPSHANYINKSLGLYERQYLPSQPKSLAGIACRAFLLGIVFCLSSCGTIAALLLTNSPLWRLSFFLTLLSTFHFLEFFFTAYYNTRGAIISSFLLSQNGQAYNVAQASAMLECLARNLLFPKAQFLPGWLSQTLLCFGLELILLGQVVRSRAMVEAGTNFNHIVQSTKSPTHRLVTTGVYGWLRHPSYFGFFWWAIGTQLLLGNPICGLGYTVVLWKFFERRIHGEEGALRRFFGKEYVKYWEDVGTGIPFVR